IVDRRRLGLDIGDDALLENYQHWRRADALLLAAVTDSLNRLFSNAIAPLRLARDFGLAIVHRMPPLKRVLMQHAMGLLGDRPRLARVLRRRAPRLAGGVPLWGTCRPPPSLVQGEQSPFMSPRFFFPEKARFRG